MNKLIHSCVLITLCCGAASPHVAASFYQPPTFEGWHSAVDGQYTTIDFTGFPAFTAITTQYADVGVVFPDGDDFIWNGSFPQDGWGLRTTPFDDTITVLFSEPQRWIGMHHPAIVQMTFYLDGQFLFEDEATGGGGEDFFHGLISDQFFDKVEIVEPLGPPLGIDNLYFGGAVPAPAGLALLALTALARQRRRP